MKKFTPKKFFLFLTGFFLLTFAVGLISLKWGYQNTSWKNLFEFLQLCCNGKIPEDKRTLFLILYQIRLPRVVLAFFVGAALSLAGMVFQSLLRNPLAEPHLIGVSSGAALGKVLAFFLFSSTASSLALSSFFSFAGSFLSILLIYTLSLRRGILSVYSLLLTGVILNSFFVSLIIFMETVAEPDKLAGIFSWLLGNLSMSDFSHTLPVCLCLAVSSFILCLTSKELNLLSLGEEKAKTLGLSVERAKIFYFLLASFITSMAVMMSGLIAFIGLVVPHITRILFGADHRQSLPFSAFVGGILLMISDTVARTALAPQEIPVGVITSFFGAPFFIYLLRRKETRRLS